MGGKGRSSTVNGVTLDTIILDTNPINPTEEEVGEAMVDSYI